MKLKQLLMQLRHDETAQDLIEYALVAGCVAFGAIASMKSLASSVATVFAAVGATLNSAV